MELAWGLLEKKYIFVYFFSCFVHFCTPLCLDGRGGRWGESWEMGWMDGL